ncbi:MAG: hypothetical protein ABFR95_09895 [Actinomycetota bacterium]
MLKVGATLAVALFFVLALQGPGGTVDRVPTPPPTTEPSPPPSIVPPSTTLTKPPPTTTTTQAPAPSTTSTTSASSTTEPTPGSTTTTVDSATTSTAPPSTTGAVESTTIVVEQLDSGTHSAPPADAAPDGEIVDVTTSGVEEVVALLALAGLIGIFVLAYFAWRRSTGE